MIEINKKDISILEYEIDLEGLSLEDISQIRFNIYSENMIYTVLGILDGKVIQFKLSECSYLKNNEYTYTIEIITQYYIFEVIRDVLILTEPKIKVKMKNHDTMFESKITEKNRPIVKLKL